MLHEKAAAAKTAHTPNSVEVFLRTTPLSRGIHCRCPGCFAWAKIKSMTEYPAGTIDDQQSFLLCMNCDRSMRHKTERVSVIVANIGAYAGWADVEVSE